MTSRRELLKVICLTALTAARGAYAQTVTRSARVGIIEYGAPPSGSFANGYLAALGRIGFGEPKTLSVERRFARGNAARYGELLLDLVAARVDLALAIGHDIAQVAKTTTPALPLVAVGSEDPVMSGLIESYRSPGGNITGVTYLSPELAAKRLELLKEMVPALARVSVLWDPSHFDTYYRDMEPVARGVGIRLQLLEAREPAEIENAFAEARRARADAMFIVPSRMINLQAQRIGELALSARLPTIAAYASFAEAGGLMSYGAVAAEMLQRAAAQSARILGGAKAGTLPFERAQTFELVVNRRTAKALDLEVPQTLLGRADRIIE